MAQLLQAPTEAWDRFKYLLRACAHHGFSELHELDTFYNALNSKDQDSLNSTAGGNFLDKIPHECLSIIESKYKVRYSRDKPVVAKVSTNASTSGISPDVAELKDMVKALLLDKKVPLLRAQVVENEPEVTKDTVNPTNNGNTEDVQPQAVQSESPVLSSKPAIAPRQSDAIFYVEKLSLPDLTPTYMTLELANRSISRPVRVTKDIYVKVGSVYFQADFVVVDFDADPRVPLILGISLLKTGRALIDVFEGEDKLSVIITKDLSVEEKNALITVLKSHKRAIAWKLSDIKRINPEFYTHKILMKEDFEPIVQHQRSVNPKIHDVIKQEVIKLLDVGLIYLISDSPWVSLVHCVPKKGGFTVVENEDNELIPTHLVTRWRVCIDFCKLNESTRKDHFPLPFMDQMLEILAGNQYYCFLDSFLVISKFPSILRIKRKPHSPAHMERLLIATCLLGYAMLQARFIGA
nr:reverse transcriptase domain-containing protein [Tanacetum cinerariifolium]